MKMMEEIFWHRSSKWHEFRPRCCNEKTHEPFGLFWNVHPPSSRLFLGVQLGLYMCTNIRRTSTSWHLTTTVQQRLKNALMPQPGPAVSQLNFAACPPRPPPAGLPGTRMDPKRPLVPAAAAFAQGCLVWDWQGMAGMLRWWFALRMFASLPAVRRQGRWAPWRWLGLLPINKHGPHGSDATAPWCRPGGA